MDRIVLVLFCLVVGGKALSMKSDHSELGTGSRTVSVESFENAIDDEEVEPRASCSCTCGVKKLSRIVGGDEATKNEYPWMAVICNGRPCNYYTYWCGGSLINDRYILTAAHCIKNLTAENVTVSLGDHSLIQSTETASVEFEVKKLIVHGRYQRSNLDNDIGLIRLKTKVKMTDTIRPICLSPTTASYEGKTAYVTGWGDKMGLSYLLITARFLQEVSLTVLPQTQCKNSYDTGKITDSMFCATGVKKDACDGDSGGPLIIKDSNGYYDQIGVVSWGTGCAGSYPGVFTVVNKYIEWIRKHSGKAQFCKDMSPN